MVFKRNFISYFLNPTGYVFICVFVLLSSIAAFLPDEFVNSNLANLSCLNTWFPLIMLIFVPAITMGIWADERRQGTEELLLTLPVTTSRLLLGKYFAAVGIFTVSLLFSVITNWLILDFLGNPDPGLFFTTCLGYELIGVAMLSVGMVASFLSSQLTIAYILGGLFCVPFVALQWADAAPVSHQTAVWLKSLGMNGQFEPFGRGMITLSGLLYFLLIPVVMLYIGMILMNQRYWIARHPWWSGLHYGFRTVALVVAVLALVGLSRTHDVQFDMTAERLSSLSGESLQLIRENHAKYPVVIEAWLSPEVPQEFVQTRLDMISVLHEIQNRSPETVYLDIREIQPNTKQAWQLERQYDIKPKKVVFDVRGRVREESIFLSVVFKCGPRTMTIPFLNRGLSVEYELVGSYLNLCERTRKSIGILRTDASLLGRYDQQGRQSQIRWSIIDELSRQYEIVDVDPSHPINEKDFDVLLAVQPSSLGQTEMAHFGDALRRGVSTVIFEDPYPIFAEFASGTTLQRKGRTAEEVLRPKGEFGLVPAMLGILYDTNILWKNYNPYPKLAGLGEDFIFIDANMIQYNKESEEAQPKETEKDSAPAAFASQEKSVAKLEHLLFPFCGSIKADPRAETQFTPLIQTDAGGTASVKDIAAMGIRSHSRKRTERPSVYTVAARVTGPVPVAFRLPNQKTTPSFNVVFVTDLDLLTPGFFRLREMGTDVRSGVIFDFDNVTFVLNLLDTAAGRDELIAIRSRRPHHRTLDRIEQTTRAIRDRAMVDQIGYMKEFEAFRLREEEKLQARIQELSNRKDASKQLTREESMELQSAVVGTQQRLTRLLEEKQRLYDRKVEESQREVDDFVRQVQGRFRLFAVLLPPIFPLCIGLVVLLYRNRQRGVR